MYGKIFDSIYDGTLYGQWEAIVTMQQLIVLADAQGVVDMTPPAIAARTSIPLEIIEKGLRILAEPDPYSRTEGSDGKRIELLDDHRPWGWVLVNHQKYRQQVAAEDKRAAATERKRRQREREKGEAEQAVTEPVTPCHAASRLSRHTEAEAEAVVTSPNGDVANAGRPARGPACPYEAIRGLWAKHLPENPQPEKSDTWQAARKAAVRKLWQGKQPGPDLDEWDAYFTLIAQSEFLTGRTQPRAGSSKPFAAYFDWAMKPGNLAKVIEGNYS